MAPSLGCLYYSVNDRQGHTEMGINNKFDELFILDVSE